MAVRPRLALLAALVAVCLVIVVPSADARRTFCSASGDVCYGAFGKNTSVHLRLTLAAHFFTNYKLCVRAPTGRTDCRRFRVHATTGGMFGSSVAWIRHFQLRGPGTYRASWTWAGSGHPPSITFRVKGPAIVVVPTTVRSGRRVHVFGLAGGCPRGDLVTLMSRAFPSTQEFAGVPAVFARVRAHDLFGLRVRIPPGATARHYTITGRCGGGNLGVEAHFRVHH